VYDKNSNVERIIFSQDLTRTTTPEKGDIVCKTDNSLCGLVVEDNLILTAVKNEKGHLTLKRINMPTSTVAYKIPEKNIGDKYDDDFYKKLYGKDYPGGTGNGVYSINNINNILKTALEK
jgi:hypothetical protein